MKKHKTVSAKFIALIAIVILPMLIAWILYHYHTYFSLRTLNQGILINPPSHLANFSDNDRSWKIIDVSIATCKIASFNKKQKTSESQEKQVINQHQKKLFILHQLRQALGKDSKRVRILSNTNPSEKLSDITVLTPLQQTSLFKATDSACGRIYLMDPLGNLFMYYPEDTDAMPIFKDIKRVLEVSQIG